MKIPDVRSGNELRGVNLDPQTRCEHYHGPTDIIAIKMKCCGVYYACKDCHVALADHPMATGSSTARPTVPVAALTF